MGFIKLKDDIDFGKLEALGFIEDPANCEPGDTYYHLNNYYLQIGDFRITVSTISRHIDILCLVREVGLHNIFNLKPLYDLISSGMVELPKK